MLVAAAVVVLLLLAWFGWPLLSPEPGYGGRTLSSWLRQLDDGDYSHGLSWMAWHFERSANQEEAAAAIRQMGTNSLPFLLRSITNQDSRLVAKLNDFLEKRKWSWRAIIIRQQGPTHGGFWIPADGRRREAALAFEVLGPVARPAVPQLENALTNSPAGPKDAALALAGIGPEGYAALTRTIVNWQANNDWPGMCAVWALAAHHASAPGMIDAIVGVVTNRSSSEAGMSCWALGELRQEPQRVVPLLIASLQSSNSEPRWGASLGLANFGTNAASAVPALIQALNDSDATVRTRAQEALKTIDPAAAKRAGVK